jgi:hypothetical protein
LSYSLNDEIYTNTYTVSEDLTETESVFPQIGIPNGSILNWVKLELGSTATAFSPRPYAEELAMCQRYFQPVKVEHIRADWITKDSVEFMAPLSCPMRLYNPTLYGEIKLCNFDIDLQQLSGFNYQYYNDSENSAIKVIAIKANHGLTDAMLEFKGDTCFDAEIY